MPPQMVAAEQAEGVEDPAEDPRHRRLARTRGTGEDEVPFGRLHGQSLAGPQPGHVQLRGQRLDLPLHRLEAHHALQLGECLLEQGRIRRSGRQRRRGHAGLLAHQVALGRQAAGRRFGSESFTSRPSAPNSGLRPSGPSSTLAPGAERQRGQVGRLVVAVALGDRREPRGGVHEGRVHPVHRPVQGQGGGGTSRALVCAGQPVAQLLALWLLAAAAHQGGGEQRLGLPEHLEAHPGHPPEQTGLDAEHGVVDQWIGVPDQLLPVP